jgi:uncharacterized repeat protein (TIGR03847 family)
MSMTNFRFEDPNHLVIGTIGLPGEREFFLQVGNGENVSSFALEKSQAEGLARKSIQLLQDLNLKKQVDNHRFQLITPLESEFQIGVITITWRPESERFHIEVEGIEDAGENGFARESQGLEIIVSPDLLTAFSSHTLEVVAAGRQPCIFCGNPVNSDGHLCPRSNGYRRMG